MIEVLNRAGAEIHELAARLAPAVAGFAAGAYGGGVVIAKDRVLTLADAVRDDAVEVAFGDGRRAPARLAARDRARGVALLDVATGETPPVPWRPAADATAIGLPVVALANPWGAGLHAAAGFVSSVGRARGRSGGADVVEHTAPLPRGSAGGPLVDLDGRLVGLSALRHDPGLVVALTLDAAGRERTAALAGGAPPAPSLGVGVVEGRVAARMRRAVGLAHRDGLLVRSVAAGSAAERAGIAPGDLIVSLAGSAVARAGDVHRALDGLEAPAEVEVLALRGADEHRATLRFDDGEVPDGRR
jgi:serine protease Do